MNGFNLSDIIDAKFGGTSLSAIYFGSNKLWPLVIDYSREYLTIKSLADNNTISFKKSESSAPTKTIYWSSDKKTWNRVSSTSSGTTIKTLSNNEKIYIKGSNNNYASSATVFNYFISTAEFNISGNIMSLIYGDNFVGQTTLTANYTFRSLFWQGKIVDASNLILPATTLTNYCYGNMFFNCTLLTTAPELPATTLAAGCYSGMFGSCTSLTAAPELPATTLAAGCYNLMFGGCISLNYIKAMFTTTPSASYTDNWVNGVAASGTFIRNDEATWDVIGDNGIPTGWTIYPKIYSRDHFTIESLEDNNDIQLYKRSTDAPTITIQWSTDGTNWNNFTSSTSTTPITTLNTGDKIMIKGINTQYASADNNNASQLLKSTKTINVYGNIMSLLYGDNFVGQTTLTANYTFRALFQQGKIVDASNLILPATTLSQYCYRNMFDANTSLIAAPKVLPAMTLTNSCYMNMFIGCSSLTSVPSDMLPATTLAQYCYQGFLANCTKLVNSPVLPATTLVPYCYQSMFQGCSNLKSITCLATDISATRCLNYWLFNVGGGGTFTKKSGVSYSTGFSGIPSSWTVINI